MGATPTPLVSTLDSSESADGKSIRVVALLVVLGFLLASGLWKAAWLNHAWTHYTVNPGWDNPSQGRIDLLIGLIGPVSTLIVSAVLWRSKRTLTNNLLKIGKICCLVAVLPWLFLMMSGVPV